MKPLVSILIPAFNAAPWIDAAIDSALAQTWPRCEIVVVDDGSRDDTLALVQAHAIRHPGRVTVVTQPNSGAAAARNHALRLAKGDYIQFLDADDLLASDKVACQLEALARSPAGTVASAAWGVFTTDITQAHFQSEPVWADFAPADWLVCSWSGGGMMHPAAWLSPREVITQAGPWDERLSLDDDGEYFCRVVLASAGIRFVAAARSYYRSHSGARLSASAGERAAASSFLSCELKESALLARSDSAAARHAVACNFQRFAWEQLATAPALARQAIARGRSRAPGLPPPRGGRLQRSLAVVLGWRLARRLELALRPLLQR